MHTGFLAVILHTSSLALKDTLSKLKIEIAWTMTTHSCAAHSTHATHSSAHVSHAKHSRAAEESLKDLIRIDIACGINKKI